MSAELNPHTLEHEIAIRLRQLEAEVAAWRDELVREMTEAMLIAHVLSLPPNRWGHA